MPATAGMRVVVRLRPSDTSVMTCNPHVGTHIQSANGEGYDFSSVLGIESTQREAYLECGVPIIEAALDGQQCCLFAYGQTGAGKTFSLLGAEGGKNPHKLDVNQQAEPAHTQSCERHTPSPARTEHASGVSGVVRAACRASCLR